jgi:hypothetical protein
MLKFKFSFNHSIIQTNLINFKSKTSNFSKFQKRNFQILTPQEYLVNMKESMKRLNVESCVLRPLPEASKAKFLTLRS